MALIDHTNFSTSLKLSTNPRGSTPNGNIYFNTTTGRLQLITVEDGLTQVNFGAGLVANPLTDADGVTMRALYDFESWARTEGNETLRNFKRFIAGTYRFSGAFNFVNGRKLDTDADRKKIRGSGFIEYADTVSGVDKDRIYHGVLSLNPIQSGTTSYWTIVAPGYTEADLQAATWTDFAKTGSINEVVQVYGSTAFGDTNAGNVDNRLNTLVVRTRSWGYNTGEATSVASGVTEFSGNSAGYGVGETLNPSNTYTLANVYGGSKIAPWTGMSLVKLASPQVETGFNEADGSFTWVLHNTGGGTVQQCAAFLDALALQNADIDDSGTAYNGKKGRIWYTRNASGKVVTSIGLFIEGLSVSEKQSIIMTDNSAAAKTYPYFPSCEITVGAAAVADLNAWYQVFYVDGAAGADFDTAGAVTVKDSDGVDVKGNVNAKAVGNKISFAYSYDTETSAGLTAGTDKAMVAIVEGDGGVAQAITYFTMTRTAVVAVSCIPPVDNNA